MGDDEKRRYLGDLLVLQVVPRLRERLQAERRADHDEEKGDAKQCGVSLESCVKG